MPPPNVQDVFDEEFLARLGRLELIAKRRSARGTPGTSLSRKIGDGLEFADHRAYAPGDDIRFVDWRYFARMEKLLLRMFHEHSESDVRILLDTSASMAPGGRTAKFDHARRIAAAMAFVAMASGRRALCQPFADEPAPALRSARNKARIVDVLTFLADLRPGGATNLLCCADRSAREDGRAGTTVLITDALGCTDALDPALARLSSAGGDLVLLHVFTPEDADATLAGAVLLVDAETSKRTTLDITEPIRESYRRQWKRFRDGLEATCRARRTVYVPADSRVPFEQLLLVTFRKAGALA